MSRKPEEWAQILGQEDGDAMAIAVMDVKHHWEQYAGEAQNIARKMTERLEGRLVTFDRYGISRDAFGRVLQVTDDLGEITVLVQLIRENGEDSKFTCTVPLEDIKTMELKK